MQLPRKKRGSHECLGFLLPSPRGRLVSHVLACSIRGNRHVMSTLHGVATFSSLLLLVSCRPARTAMGFAKKRAASSSVDTSKPTQKFTKKDDRLRACPHWKRTIRTLLRSYPDQTGCLINVSESSLRKAFSPKLLHDKLNDENCELINRPPMGVNLLCATLDAGMEVLNVLPATKQVGADVLKKTFTDNKFAAAVKTAQKVSDRPSKDVAAATRIILAAFEGPSDGKDELGRALTAMADASSRLWAMSVAALEAKALVARQAAWAKSVPHLEQQPPGVQKFSRDPSIDALASATGAAYDSAYYWGGKKAARRKFGEKSASEKTSSDNKKPKKKSKKDPSPSQSSTTNKKKDKKKDRKKGGKKARSSSTSSTRSMARTSAKKPGKSVDGKHFVEVDEGQHLEVDGTAYGNCCLALSLGRAVAGPDGSKETVQEWARVWLAALPDNMRQRMARNEAELGEAMYDDYVEVLTRNDDRAVVFVMASDGTPVTRVWAGAAATWDDMHPRVLKLASNHFTTLFAKDGAAAHDILPHLPPVEMFSYVGPPGNLD